MTRQIFKPLDYQAKAAEAVVDCFAGQPRIEGVTYQIDPGAAPAMQASMFEEGLRNAPLKLSDTDLLGNIRKLQMAQHLPPSSELERSKAAPLNLDVEMETGTGKTYVYIDTMYRVVLQRLTRQPRPAQQAHLVFRGWRAALHDYQYPGFHDRCAFG